MEIYKGKKCKKGMKGPRTGHKKPSGPKDPPWIDLDPVGGA